MSKIWAFHFGLLTSIRNGHLSRLNNEPKLSCCIGLSRSLACNHQRVRDIIFLSCLRRSEAVASVHARPVVIVAAASDLESLPPSFFSQLSLLGYTEGPRKKKQQDARTRKKIRKNWENEWNVVAGNEVDEAYGDDCDDVDGNDGKGDDAEIDGKWW